MKDGEAVENGRRKDRELGQAVVEWAVLFPVFLLLVFGIIDFSWIGYQRLMFESSFQMTAWDFALNLQHPDGGSLSDNQICMNVEPISYDESSTDAVMINKKPYTLGEGIKRHMLQSSFGMLNEDKLTVASASAVFEIKVVKDAYGDQTGNPAENFVTWDNYKVLADLEGDLEYRIKVLTPVGRILHPSGEVVLKKKLVRKRTERVVVKRVVKSSP